MMSDKMKIALAITSASLATLICGYIAINNAAPWGLIAVYWAVVAIKNWRDTK